MRFRVRDMVRVGVWDRVRVRLWIVWYVDAQAVARSIGGGDRRWLCMLRIAVLLSSFIFEIPVRLCV